MRIENISFLKDHLQNLMEYRPDLKEKLEKISEILKKNTVESLTDRKSKVHLTASAVVFKGKKCYFIRHPYLKIILLPAGHVENGEIPVETAIREFHEETGFFAEEDKNIQNSGLIDINLINIPENQLKSEPEHLHIDFRYKLLLNDRKGSQKAELEWFLLAQDEADDEFKKYYKEV